MKVKIGNYKGWASAHSLLKKFRPADYDKDDNWMDWVADKLQPAINVLWNNPSDQFFPRKIKVKIDRWDVWNLDHTLALIISPALKIMKEDKQSAPYVDMEDVPENLREVVDRTSSIEGSLHWARWEYVLDQMIWAFDQKLIEDGWDTQYHDATSGNFDMKGMTAHQERISNGLRLFGKYFEGLWT